MQKTGIMGNLLGNDGDKPSKEALGRGDSLQSNKTTGLDISKMK